MSDDTHRIGPVSTCPECGHHTAYATTSPVFAYGVHGGSRDIDGYDCADCGHTWGAA